MRNDILTRMAQTGSPRQLAVLRIAIGLHILLAVQSRIFDLLLAVSERQAVRTVFPAGLDAFIAAHLVEPLVLLMTILAGLMILGLYTRVVIPALTATFVLLFSFYYLGTDAPIHWLYFWFPLLVLCFARPSDVWSLDAFRRRSREATPADPQAYRWPAEMMSLWFVYIYFAAGLAKILPLNKGVQWLNGITSQDIIYNRFLDSPFFYLVGQPFFNYAEVAWVFTGLSIVALLTELSTVVILLTARWNLVILFLLASMHLFLYLTGVAGFLQAALILGIALLPPAWFGIPVLTSGRSARSELVVGAESKAQLAGTR